MLRNRNEPPAEPSSSSTSLKRSTRSRNFHFRYMELCRAKNLTPLSEVRNKNKTPNTLDIFGDKLSVNDWVLIAESLYNDQALQSLNIRMRRYYGRTIENLDTERKAKLFKQKPSICTSYVFNGLARALVHSVELNKNLNILCLEGLPFNVDHMELLSKSISSNESLKEISFQRSHINDYGCSVLCNALKYMTNVEKLNLCDCDLTTGGAECVAELIKIQKIRRFSEGWQNSLRYREINAEQMSGLRFISLSNNPYVQDDGFKVIIEILKDDVWVKVLEMENCGLTDISANVIADFMDLNTTIQDLNVRNNPGISKCMMHNLFDQFNKIDEDQQNRELGAQLNKLHKMNGINGVQDLTALKGFNGLNGIKKLLEMKNEKHADKLDSENSVKKTNTPRARATTTVTKNGCKNSSGLKSLKGLNEVDAVKIDRSQPENIDDLPKFAKKLLMQLKQKVRTITEELELEREAKINAERQNERLNSIMKQAGNGQVNVPDGFVLVKEDSLRQLISERNEMENLANKLTGNAFAKSSSPSLTLTDILTDHNLLQSSQTSIEMQPTMPTKPQSPKSALATYANEESEDERVDTEDDADDDDENYENDEEELQTPVTLRPDHSGMRLGKVRKVRSEMKYVEQGKMKSLKTEVRSDHEYANEVDFQLNAVKFEQNIGDAYGLMHMPAMQRNEKKPPGDKYNVDALSFASIASANSDCETSDSDTLRNAVPAEQFEPMKIFIKRSGKKTAKQTCAHQLEKGQGDGDADRKKSPRSLFLGAHY